MKHRLAYLVIVLGLLFLDACVPERVAFKYTSVDTTVMSRGVNIPVTYVHPIAVGDEQFPLVVMAHGFGGSRNETGIFTMAAEELAALGVASIRMDFPGSGDSTESFANNNLGNMLKDIAASRDYAIAQAEVDSNSVGLLGWSMGGRLVVLAASQDDSYSVVATWAPAVSNGAGSMMNSFGGREAYDDFKARALRDGSVPFKTFWGLELELGLQFFTDMEQTAPLDAVQAFEGPLLVLYGDLDDVVLPEVSESLIDAAVNSPEVLRHVVKGADHGLGVFSDEPHLTQEVVATTVEFLASRL